MKETKFKQTEVGMIPSDWEETYLGNIGPVKMCKRVMKYQTSEKGDIPFYKIGTFGKSPDAYISKDLYHYLKHKYSFPPKGTILISAAGTIGRTVVYDGKDAFFQDSNIVWLENDESVLTNQYLYYLYQVVEWKTENGGAVSRLYNDNFKITPIAIPSSKKEQQRIANALSDVDTLIANLEKIIAKKKNIKQGAMQQLLTGKKRLPGFAPAKPTYKQTELGKIPTDWEYVSILDILTSSKDGIKIGPFGSQLKKEYLMSSGTYKVFGQENIYSHNFVDCYRFLSKERFNQLKSCELKEGDFIISTMGTIGKCDVVPTNAGVGIMDSHLVRLRLGNCCDANFFKHFFQSYLIQNQISALSVGGIMNGLSTSIIKRLLVLRINKNEQTAIANVLSDMDTEISALETKLAKYRQLKTGMMQQLLTGKIRLV